MSADERADRNELTRVDSFQWPSGHVGHLSQGQQGALEKFKTLCQQKGYYDPGNDQKPATHDDETLLRYLRARKFIPQDAFAQLKETEDWRQENKLDQLYETIDVEEYDQARRLYPQWTGRRDKRGLPVYVFEVGHLNSKKVAANQTDKGQKSDKESIHSTSQVPRKMLRLFALYEHLCRFVQPLCAAMPDRPNAETPVSQSNNIVDISKVGLKQFWDLRAHMQDASKLATAHYPETLDRIFIIGAPSFFPTVWEWVKRWFDPITVSKIFIVSNANLKSTLEKYMDIDDIPKKYGGNLDWSFGDMPALDAGITNNLRWKEDVRYNGNRTIPMGPIQWQYDQDGDLVAVAIGTENGQQRHQVFAGLHPEAGVARLALSPGRSQNNPSIAAVAGGTNTNTSSSSKDHSDTKKMASHPSTTADAAASGSSYSVPYRDHENDVHAPPLDGRQGTSESRYEQQAATHAHGQLQHGTPSVQTDGQGVTHTIIEPRTVGQAPKETILNRDEEPAQPGILEQAQTAAGNVAAQAAQLPSTVMSAVGLGSKTAETADGEASTEAQSSTTQGGDARVDEMGHHIVEEYLRTQNMSKPAHHESK